MSQFLFNPPDDFDPMKHARFRGKPLGTLSHEELLDALIQALKELRAMSQRS